MTSWDEPVWDPLLTLLRVYVDDFMWMFRATLEDGTQLHAYKHRETRRYLHLSEDGPRLLLRGAGLLLRDRRSSARRPGHADAVRLVVPHISSFYGITIWMYYDEPHHLGRPHFHARYGEDEASIDIESLQTLAGRLPIRARRLVVEWALEHRTQLRDNWKRAREWQPLMAIEPLG
jgi:Domain of unknown function (DUF4160)